jgi:hypothetical protein
MEKIVMTEKVGNEAHWDPLVAIASEELDIHSFTESGKPTHDVRLVRLSSVAQALERAYDLGLLIGHTVSRAEHPMTKRSKLACRSEQDWVRAAAQDILNMHKQ